MMGTLTILLLGVLHVVDARVVPIPQESTPRIHVTACGTILKPDQRILTKEAGEDVVTFFRDHFRETIEWTEDCSVIESSAQYNFRLLEGKDPARRYRRTLVYMRGDEKHSAIVVRYKFAHRISKKAKCSERKLVSTGIVACIILRMSGQRSLNWFEDIDLPFINRGIPQGFMNKEMLAQAGLK